MIKETAKWTYESLEKRWSEDLQEAVQTFINNKLTSTQRGNCIIAACDRSPGSARAFIFYLVEGLEGTKPLSTLPEFTSHRRSDNNSKVCADNMQEFLSNKISVEQACNARMTATDAANHKFVFTLYYPKLPES